MTGAENANALPRPRLLDLFCGAGGAAVGYNRAGFDITGVDIRTQPNYPYRFVQADAMTFPLDGYDAIHASPPCQDHSATAALWRNRDRSTGWMLAATRDRLLRHSVPWVIENVGGARPDMGAYWVQLCGSAFGLGVLRHRLFAASIALMVPPCAHHLIAAPLYIYGHSEDAPTRDRYENRYGIRPGHAERAAAMGIDWMTRDELCQAIPPAYTEYIGAQLIRYCQPVREDVAL